MAKTARKESEEVAEIVQPDFDKAYRIITQDIHPNEEALASRRGTLAGEWKAIADDCHVNKQAAKLFAKMLKMSPETRDDYLRSLYGLMRVGNIGISEDLVDRAEGKVEQMPVARNGASDEEWDRAAPPASPGITGDNLPPELKPKPRRKPDLVTVN